MLYVGDDDHNDRDDHVDVDDDKKRKAKDRELNPTAKLSIYCRGVAMAGQDKATEWESLHSFEWQWGVKAKK